MMPSKEYYDNAHQTLADWANDPNLRPEDHEVIAELITETKEQSENDNMGTERNRLLAEAAVRASNENAEAHRDGDWTQNPDSYND